MKFKIALLNTNGCVLRSWKYTSRKKFEAGWSRHELRYILSMTHLDRLRALSLSKDGGPRSLVAYQEGTPASPDWQEFRRVTETIQAKKETKRREKEERMRPPCEQYKSREDRCKGHRAEGGEEPGCPECTTLTDHARNQRDQARAQLEKVERNSRLIWGVVLELCQRLIDVSKMDTEELQRKGPCTLTARELADLWMQKNGAAAPDEECRHRPLIVKGV